MRMVFHMFAGVSFLLLLGMVARGSGVIRWGTRWCALRRTAIGGIRLRRRGACNCSRCNRECQALRFLYCPPWEVEEMQPAKSLGVATHKAFLGFEYAAGLGIDPAMFAGGDFAGAPWTRFPGVER